MPYLDDDGILRCENCGMRVHKNPNCDEVIRRNFTKYMHRVVVKDGSESTDLPFEGNRGRA